MEYVILLAPFYMYMSPMQTRHINARSLPARDHWKNHLIRLMVIGVRWRRTSGVTSGRSRPTRPNETSAIHSFRFVTSVRGRFDASEFPQRESNRCRNRERNISLPGAQTDSRRRNL